MNITTFQENHIGQAVKLVIANYRAERQQLPFLPPVEQLPMKGMIPEMEHFAKNGLGVAAMEKNRLLGFLCAYKPREDAFGSTGVRGTFVPIHAHGTSEELIGADRDRIYSRMYQEAGRRWIEDGIRSHAIALYTHDTAAVNSFFYQGFGLRCIDLLRSLEEELEPIEDCRKKCAIEYKELSREEWNKLLQLHNGLLEHLESSPVFMRFPAMDEAMLYEHTSEDTRYFTASTAGEYIAYIKIADEGENFVTEHAGMPNICGAYCKQEYRGRGIYHNLLSYLISVLRKEGYTLLGVDCESFNPTARAFWTKYFREYTRSVVRRIDERAVDKVLIKTQN